MLRFADSSALPLLFHLNTEPWLNEEAYNDPAAEVHWSAVRDPDAAVPLPRAPADSPLARLLRNRRSCRSYESRSMPLSLVAALLEAAYGAHGTLRRENGLLSATRPVPSAGGLYPLEVYVAASRVEGLADGIHSFNVLHHCLEPVPPKAPFPELGSHLLAQYFLQNANLVVFLAAVFERSLRKYGPRGYRYILLEAGHVAQNLCLAAAAASLGSLCIGGFRDARLNQFLGLDGTTAAVVYGVGIGHPRES